MTGPTGDEYPRCGLCGLVLRSSEPQMALPDRGRVHQTCTRRGAMIPTCAECHTPIVGDEAHLHADGRAWHAHHGEQPDTIPHGTRCDRCDERIEFGQQYEIEPLSLPDGVGVRAGDRDAIYHLQCAEIRRWIAARRRPSLPPIFTGETIYDVRTTTNTTAGNVVLDDGMDATRRRDINGNPITPLPAAEANPLGDTTHDVSGAFLNCGCGSCESVRSRYLRDANA